jgi:hypothetical protein
MTPLPLIPRAGMAPGESRGMKEVAGSDSPATRINRFFHSPPVRASKKVFRPYTVVDEFETLISTISPAFAWLGSTSMLGNDPSEDDLELEPATPHAPKPKSTDADRMKAQRATKVW